jgi:hypothetical protein
MYFLYIDLKVKIMVNYENLNILNNETLKI